MLLNWYLSGRILIKNRNYIHNYIIYLKSIPNEKLISFETPIHTICLHLKEPIDALGTLCTSGIFLLKYLLMHDTTKKKKFRPRINTLL